MKNRWLALPLHCFLFVLIPLASQLAFNLGQVLPREALRPALVALALVALALIGLHRSGRNLFFSGLVLSLGSILFFAYGHLFTLLLVALHSLSRAVGLGLEGSGIVLAAHGILLLVLPALLVATGLLLRRRESWWLPGGVFFNAFGVVALLIPMLQIASYQWRVWRVDPPSMRESSLTDFAAPGQIAGGQDIYYIVLDGYGRADVLRQGYGFDNSEFLSDLESLGFFVADRSRSNYSQTILSQTSTLNVAYLDDLSLGLGSDADHFETNASLTPLMRHSRVRQLLEQRGYRFIAFATGFGLTEIVDADLHLAPSYQGSNTFESLVARTSALSVIEDGASLLRLPYPYSGYGSHRERVRFAFDTLPEVAGMVGAKFVYVHLLVPHPPFVFDAGGNPVEPHVRYTLGDGSDYPLDEEEYVDGYREQVRYVNDRLLEVLPELIGASEKPPLIIIQGDHGPGARLQWDRPSERAINERMTILNAYLLPADQQDLLYPEISPVNSFRVLFKGALGLDLELLPDRHYYSSTSRPFSFREVP